ncbi:putative spermidine/putrescine transport system permease protein [Neobacillus niacini]|uniref:ABC transporter permease n=1 Tax=Neobacillus driksii TaxID=3035913 RepID=UPI002784EACE|nr:ABC transporter permease subunit [Neobacillus niacini]MDQ0971151.1 putative spermidine/putrescine transport system permease protein [Neobacillus niacini]
MFYSKSKSIRLLISAGMLFPALFIVGGSFIAGLIICGIQSLDYFPLIGKRTLSLHVYIGIFQSAVFYRSLIFSLGISLVATVLAALIAVILALWLRKYVSQGGWLHFLLQFNLPIPHVVGAIAILILFGQSGLISRLAYWAGIIQQPSQFPIWVTDQFGIGIVLEYVWKEVPFIAVSVLSILKSWTVPYEKQLQLLGANRWQRWRFATFPFMLPALLSSSIIVFAYTFGSFEVPYILGSVSMPTLPILAYQAYLNPDLSYRPEAMAINTIITIISMILIILYIKWGGGYAAKRQ